MMAAFTITSIAFSIILIVSVNNECIQLHSALKSDYDYSVTTQKAVNENDYIVFDAGMDFALSANSQTSLNVDIVMQRKGTAYTDSVYWNPEDISADGVAISKNLASSNGIKQGDKLYSKHIVSGKISEYTVEQIVPEVINIRNSKDSNYGNGVIIMGYDEQYVKNISHHFIAFTSDSIDEISKKCLGTAENIVYRDDEITSSIIGVVPYIAAFFIIAITAGAVFAFMLNKTVSHNTKRLIMLGYEKKMINRSYYRYAYGNIILSAVIISALSSLTFVFIGFTIIKALVLLFIPIVELLAFIVFAVVLNKRLWRK